MVKIRKIASKNEKLVENPIKIRKNKTEKLKKKLQKFIKN